MANFELKDKKGKRKTHRLLFLFVIFIALTTIELIIFLPRVREAFSLSGVKQMIVSSKEEKQSFTSKEVQLFYVDSSGELISYTTEINLLYDTLHDTFEELLLQPPLEALENFDISYINPNARLLGATSTTKATYVDFSKEILSTEDFALCYNQIEATAKAFNGDADFVLLVEGQVVEKNSNNKF